MARQPMSPYRTGGLAERGLGADPFLSLHREVNRLFDDAFRGYGPQAGAAQGGGNLIPAHIDVSETEGEFRVRAELPGVTERDVEVTLDDDVLTIRGEKRLERKDENESYHVVERSYGTFQRSLRLPYAVDPEQVRASFEHGVLTVTLPKTKQQERARRIQVQSGGGRAQETGRAAGAGQGGKAGG